MKQILCLSHTPWQASSNRTQQLLARLSDAQILFIEPAPSRGKPMPEQGRRVREHITLYTLPAPLSSPIAVLDRFNRNRNSAFLKKMMEKHRFRAPVLWCTSPEYVELFPRIPYRGMVYDCDREWEDEFLDQESELANRADVAFAASPELVRRLSPCNDNIALLPNGVNPLMYQREDYFPPERAAALSNQIVFGIAQDITAQTELSPLLAAAKSHRKWHFLLMGHVSKKEGGILREYPNIHLAGVINQVEYPDWFSICTAFVELEQKDLRGCDILPPRIYDYMATGCPIIMMADPHYSEPFPEIIYTAFDPSGFIRRCNEALEENAMLTLLRQDCANKASWRNRADEVVRIMESTGLF